MEHAGPPIRVAPVTVIAPPARLRFPDLAEAVRYRHVLGFLVRKSLTLRYKETAIGAGWVVLQPLAMMLLLTFVFERVLSRGSDLEMPFSVFLFSALTAWQFFSTTVNSCSFSIQRERALMQKVYLPKILLPLVPVTTHLVDLGVSFVLLMMLMAFHGIAPGWTLLVLPVFVVMLLAFAAGAGVWVASLQVRYRDVPFAIPFLLQLGFFTSPILYSVDQLDERWGWIYHLNPLSSVMEGFRWSIAGGPAPGLAPVAISATVAIAILVSGLFYLGSNESDFSSIA